MILQRGPDILHGVRKHVVGLVDAEFADAEGVDQRRPQKAAVVSHAQSLMGGHGGQVPEVPMVPPVTHVHGATQLGETPSTPPHAFGPQRQARSAVQCKSTRSYKLFHPPHPSPHPPCMGVAKAAQLGDNTARALDVLSGYTTRAKVGLVFQPGPGTTQRRATKPQKHVPVHAQKPTP